MTRASRVLALAAMVGMVCSVPAFAAGAEFNATLSGAQEVSPPAPEGGVDTTMRGALVLKANEAQSSATFVLKVTNGDDVVAAHLHCGLPGVNGPVVVGLFESDPGIDVNGRLAFGTITNDDFGDNECADAIGRPINNIASLIAAAEEGLIYTNVHTAEYPGGEIRGQVSEVDDDCAPSYHGQGNGGRDHDSNSNRRH